MDQDNTLSNIFLTGSISRKAVKWWENDSESYCEYDEIDIEDDNFVDDENTFSGFEGELEETTGTDKEIACDSFISKSLYKSWKLR